MAAIVPTVQDVNDPVYVGLEFAVKTHGAVGQGAAVSLSTFLRVSIPLLKMVDQMLARGCFDTFTSEDK